MGGIFSSPSPPPMPAPPQDDSKAEQEQARLEGIERRRRGRAGTILTSERGLRHLHERTSGPKNLLGE